ncbi:hypothetical protein [Brevundimonas sp. TSRC1-1]|uniref:hypothetical protein n=1 Tax=Brevundimonas sp. TSRC1-1 TaxID=2804562 RepID=UPI003CE71B82
MIESIFAGCLATMMKADLEPSIALLKRFGTATARAQAAREIAKVSLPELERASFIKIVGEFESLAKRRNDVVHAVWAISDDHPGELLRMSDAIFATFPLVAVRSQLLGQPIEEELNTLESTLVPIAELESLIDDLRAFSLKIMPILTEGAKAFALREVQAGRIAEGVTLT